MRTLLFALAFLLLPASLSAKEDAPGSPLPASFAGAWKGPCQLIRDGKVAMTFPMELHVAPIAGAGRWTWRIVYGEGDKRQVRPYVLVPVGDEEGHYRIDENDGILLDAYVEHDRVHSRFQVAESVIESTYERTGDQLTVTLTTFGPEPQTTSGGSDGTPSVRSFPLRAVQRGTLRR